MIIAINYADENFRKAQKFNTKTAYKKGKVDKVIEYSPKDIDKRFYEDHKNILSEKRGGGYWLWKPYIVVKTLEEISEGDYLFYCDSGAYYINNIKYLINDMEKMNTDIMVFELPLIEKQWTKNELFNLMECVEEEYKESNQILGTYFLIKKSDYSMKFFEKYLKYACIEDVLNDKYDEELQCEDFIDHRHDQSLLSLLSKKEKLRPFRDPSQFGIRPWEYAGESRLIRYKRYKNSNYPKIILSQRRVNIMKFRIKESIRSVLLKCGLTQHARI